MFNDIIASLLNDKTKHITVLTGAGISAESGIPTFRGPEGYWTVGSNVYMPEEMATMRMFQHDPQAVWEWYLYRLGVCTDAQPNAGHHALVEMERKLGDRFTLITQNIDNLHIRAGNSLERTYQIHGNINYTRCASHCNMGLHHLNAQLGGKRAHKDLKDDELALLTCHQCGGWLRPHVLWFDECYDEHYFRFDSSMHAAQQTDLLITVGTSGATNLPNQVINLVARKGGTVIDINTESNVFANIATQTKNGLFIQQPASMALTELVNIL